MKVGLGMTVPDAVYHDETLREEIVKMGGLRLLMDHPEATDITHQWEYREAREHHGDSGVTTFIPPAWLLVIEGEVDERE